MNDYEDFYNKTVDIIIINDGYIDDLGIYHEGTPTKLKSVKCDIQPYSKEKAYKDYGFTIDCTNRIFLDADSDINISTIIKCDDCFYEIIKLINWESYYDCILKEHDEVIINE